MKNLHRTQSKREDDDEEEEEDSRRFTDRSSGDGSPADSSTPAPRLAQRETTAVFRLRVVVFTVLWGAACAVSVVVYLVTSRSERQDFETTFDSASAKLVESFQQIVKQRVGALNTLSVAFTSYARAVGDEWPFVTLNDFHQRVASARTLSGSFFVEVTVSVINGILMTNTNL